MGLIESRLHFLVPWHYQEPIYFLKQQQICSSPQHHLYIYLRSNNNPLSYINIKLDRMGSPEKKKRKHKKTKRVSRSVSRSPSVSSADSYHKNKHSKKKHESNTSPRDRSHRKKHKKSSAKESED